MGRVVQRLEMIVVGYRMVVEGLERIAYTWKLEYLKSRITQVPVLSNGADVLPFSFFSLGHQSSKILGNMSQEICLGNEVRGFEHGSIQLQRKHM